MRSLRRDRRPASRPAEPVAAEGATPEAEAASAATEPEVAEAAPELTPEPEAEPEPPEPEASTEPEPEPPAEPDPEPDPEPEPDPLASGRPASLRLAALHLRTGQHALARAELEALAGRGRLDAPALLDLAEVRWRTGDLAGAGEAAQAVLVTGSEPLLALVIAAEAVAAAGRPTEARGLSARALEAAPGSLDSLFAGAPRSLIWPAASPQAAAEVPRRRGRRAADAADGAPSTAAEAFAGGRAALAKGDPVRAALLLGVGLRLDPGFAEDVLRAVAGRDDQPLLALVRGDALRLLGREAEALEAFDRARGRSSVAVSAPRVDRGPGLFDDVPAPRGSDSARP